MKCLEDGAVKNSRDEKEEEEVQKKKMLFYASCSKKSYNLLDYIK